MFHYALAGRAYVHRRSTDLNLAKYKKISKLRSKQMYDTAHEQVYSTLHGPSSPTLYTYDTCLKPCVS